jgi:hypothetical protein
MNKLKNCPFCGEHVLIIKRPNKMWAISCLNLACFAWQCTDKTCKGCTDGYVKKTNAINAWNKRAE